MNELRSIKDKNSDTKIKFAKLKDRYTKTFANRSSLSRKLKNGIEIYIKTQKNEMFFKRFVKIIWYYLKLKTLWGVGSNENI